MPFVFKPFKPSVLAAAAVIITAGGFSRVSAESLLLIEADSGKVLYAENATYPWYPASLTKLMTAYVVLHGVKEGRFTLDSLFTVSQFASVQKPAKMGLPPGSQVTVDNALKMLMVRSANDIAVTIAENVSGSVENFADAMNAAAVHLGMTQSSFVNPNGMPAEDQISSARDLAILARALIREFPEYDYYWHVPAIRYGAKVTQNYNKLLGRYPGTDGMKTGFICASGFNLVATATRNDRRLIAVVLGASSSESRSVKAAQLLERGFNGAGLAWLAPQLGTVESLPPIAAAPPDLREAICGNHRRKPPAENEDDDEVANRKDDQKDPNGQQTFKLSNLGPSAKPSSLLGPKVDAIPIEVYLGPSRKPAESQFAVTRAKLKARREKAAKNAASDPATAQSAASTTPSGTTTDAPATPWLSFAPEKAQSSGDSGPRPMPVPRPRPKTNGQ